MITLADIFGDLATGELSQYSFSGDIDAPTGITTENYPALIRHVNRGLMALFTRFTLKEREVSIEMNDAISMYILDSKYAKSNDESTEPTKWIDDTKENPFTDDIIRIQAVYNEAGVSLPINDLNLTNSVFLPTYKTLQIPSPASGNNMFVTYRAMHPEIPVDTTDPSTVEIEIPEYCIEPLLTYVTGRIYSTSADQVKQALASNYMQMYEFQCKELEDKNVLYNTPNETNIKLERGGWV